MKITPRSWTPAALSALLALALYAVTLGGVYIYDDAFLIKLDPRVQSPRLWGEFWTKGWFKDGLDNLYRPLVSQSFGLEMWLHGDRPWVFHLVNILLNAGVCALVAELGRRLMGWRVALIAGLLFACHPIHSEAVAGIVGRAELACAMAILASLILFLHRPMTTRRAMAIFALSVVALLSKEQGFLLPLLLAILIPVRSQLLPDADEVDPARQKSDTDAVKLAFALVIWSTVGIFLLREEILKLRFEWEPAFLNIAIQPLAKSPPVDRWLIPLALLGRYFQLLVAPVKLSLDYGLVVIGSTISRADPYLWLGAVVAAAWCVVTFIALRRRRWTVLFCLLALAMTYSPASNVLMIATIFGERLMYLPSAFFVTIVAAAITRLPRAGGNVLLVALLCLGCVRTWTYVERWNNRDAFYEYSLRQQPKSLMIHILLADADYDNNQLATAARIMDEAESLYPGYWESWKMSALIDEKAGDWPKAARDWKRSFDLHPMMALSDRWGHALGMVSKEQAATRK